MADEKVLITESTLDNIGEAIREKNGESDLYYPNQMPAAIRRIQTGGGGSGSVVAVFPVLLSGEHIADIVVDGDRFALYAPEPIEYTPGTGIEISQSGVVSVSEALRTTISGKAEQTALDNAVAALTASVASKQNLLIPGDGITITGNTISATEVEANPQGTPTETLETIEIDGVVYEIVGGGGAEIDLVPRLTSNVAQGIGEASDNDPLSSVWLPWHAFATETEFDASINGGYWATTSADGYIEFTFDNPVTIKSIAFGVYNSCTFLVQYSNDGIIFTDGQTLSRTGPDSGYICHNEKTTLSQPINCIAIRLKATSASSHNLGAVHFYGNWGEGGGSAVSDLTDVELTNLANGQILKYNSTTQKWENANESGGGSSLPFDVVINSNDNGIDIVYDDGT